MKPNNHEIKAVLSDIDSTQIIAGNDMPSSEVQSAAQKLRCNGIPLLNVTARSHHLLKSIASPLSLDDNLCTLDGGATVAHATSGDIVWSNWLKPELARDVCLALGELTTRIYYNPDSRNFTQEQLLSDLRNSTLPRYSAAIFGVFGVDRSADILDCLNMFSDVQHTPIMDYKGHDSLRCIQIANQGVNKLTGASKMLEHAALESESILAIGDGYNDIPLFHLARNGVKVAMGNACDELKDLADWIAPPVEEHGFAVAMERYGLTR